MNKKVLVTGGLGFIGSVLVKKLKEKGFKVKIIDLKNGVDIRSDRLGGKFDIVFHLAALRSVPKSFKLAREYFDTNVYGTYRVLESFKGSRIVNISTSSADNPIAPYGLSKLLGEKIAERYKNVVSLRLFNPFGEGGCSDLVIPIFVEKMINNQQVYIHSNGKQDRDFTYVQDVAEEIIHYGLSKDTGVHTIGYGESHSVLEIFNIMAVFFGYTKDPIFLPKRIGDQIHTQAKDKMHFKPIGFYEGLNRTMRWYK